MVFEFVGGPYDGDIREMPDHQTVVYVVSSECETVAAYSREASRMVYDGQISKEEHHQRTWFWGFQNGANAPTA